MSKYNLEGLKEIFKEEAFEPYEKNQPVTETYMRDDVKFLDLPIPQTEQEYNVYCQRFKEEFIDKSPKYSAITETYEETNPMLKDIDWDSITESEARQIAKDHNVSFQDFVNIAMDSALSDPYSIACLRLNNVTFYSGMAGENE